MKVPVTLTTEQLTHALNALGLAWPVSDIQIVELLTDGYSNNNYRLQHKNQEFVLRVPKGERAHLDRQFEAEWLTALPAPLNAHVIAVAPSQGLLLTRWLAGPLMAEQEVSDQQLVRFVNTYTHNFPCALAQPTPPVGFPAG